MPSYDRRTLSQLLDGDLPAARVHAIQSSFKDPDRFEQMLAIHQERLGWDVPVLLPLGESLFVVQMPDGRRMVRCACGHEFCDVRRNWKLDALIFVRDRIELMEEIYPRMLSSDPDWMQLREFYCPGCQAQLEVEAVPPGYPILHDFEPDLDAFYRDWLGLELAPQPPLDAGR